MKKIYNSTDMIQKQGQELSKKLYRSITEHSKRLDDARSCARNIGDLFTPNLQILRRKLCDYCERLIFNEPLLYGRKAEELLWRKGFYDVVSTAKKLKKKEFSPEEISNLLTHINAGIGFYHHFLSKLQNDYQLSLKVTIDFSIRPELYRKGASELSQELSDYVVHSVYQCLIYLGDLNRYKLEIYPNWEPHLAVRYYQQAVTYRPEYGMPHNQMGTLSMNQNNYLDAVYHYMRCLSCTVPFEGTLNNLQSLFEKNSKYLEGLPEQSANVIVLTDKQDITKCFLARFLLLIDIWYFEKNVPKVYNLCHQTFKNLEECLSYMKTATSESGDSNSPGESDSVETDSSSNPAFLTNNMLFKIVVICLLSIIKLQEKQSQQTSTVVAFTLAVYSQLIQHVTTHIRESVLNYPLPSDALGSKKGARKKSKLRRRKVVQIDSEDSDASDNEVNNDSDISTDDESFISDVEDILANSSDDDEDNVTNNAQENTGKSQVNDKSENSVNGESVGPSKTAENDEKTMETVITKVKRMDVNDMLEIISEEGCLASIKILNDWLVFDTEVVKTCGQSTRSLFRQITNLLNLINVNIKSSKMKGITINVPEILAKDASIPLPEDVTLKGLEILKSSHEKLEWQSIHNSSMNLKDETIIRIAKFLSFGKTLTTIEEVGITYNKIFNCEVKADEEEQIPNMNVEELDIQETDNSRPSVIEEKDTDSSRGLSKMKHMGQLWLAAEVRALESRVRGKPSLSPYLVLDADALIKYTFMVKHLVHSRKFIVIIPSAVVSALDDLKRERLEARDAIRWLEIQFHKGNRFFRAQRPQERASIPFIKYPKKKDKEMFVYIQIVECCNYLAQQQKDSSNLVTLLVGNQMVLVNGENKEFSYVGLAKSAGVSIEGITQFYSKWKKSYKGKR